MTQPPNPRPPGQDARNAEVVRALAEALYDHEMPDGDALAHLIHISDYIDGSLPIPAQLQQVRDICAAIGRTVLSAQLALPASARLTLARRLCPETHACVPREATDAALVDGSARIRDFYTEDGPYPRAKAMWRAMLAASERTP